MESGNTNLNLLTNLWGKTRKDGPSEWHPLILHMLDVAAVADVVLEREPESTRNLMAGALGLEWPEARPWILVLIACHDLGKACPGFQCKWSERPPINALRLPRSPDTQVNHAFISQIALIDLLPEQGWSLELAELAADAVGCHHGARAGTADKDAASKAIWIGRGDRLKQIRKDWQGARQCLFEALLETIQPSVIPEADTLSGPAFMLLAGLTSFTDWIGSNEDWFTLGSPAAVENLKDWLKQRRVIAETALDFIGWHPRSPLSIVCRTFEQVFSFSPRPLQQALANTLETLVQPAILLIEAPMGEGKTEAAFFAHLELQRRFGHRGLYVALPTQATGNAMFARTLSFLQQQGTSRPLDLQLLHGGKYINPAFQNLRFADIHDPTANADVRAATWFMPQKRALLSEYGVGTVDQALLPILPVRHNFVRLWGLANRVVIFDEIHAYDAYTGTLLVHLLRWLMALNASVVLLSATLPRAVRHKIAAAVHAEGATDLDAAYPRLTVFQEGLMQQVTFEADTTRQRHIRIRSIAPDLNDFHAVLTEQPGREVTALALVNTVQRAQDLYRLFPEGRPLLQDGQRVGKVLPDGTEVLLFHARYPADWRQCREARVLAAFGSTAVRSVRKILIATQVAEQSLDIDFDLILSDLAPVDLLLQRAGRLWRHQHENRPLTEPVFMVAGLEGAMPISFGRPLWWNKVYREDVLLRTWLLLRARPQLHLPDDIDVLVQMVYSEDVTIPEALQERYDKALLNSEGESLSLKIQASQAIVGMPDDASWNQPERYVLYDEDDPMIHRTLMAKTRLGDASITCIPLWPEDAFRAEWAPEHAQSVKWANRTLRVARQGIINALQATGIPESWQQSPLLRNCFPLPLDAQGYWLCDASVCLDQDLGLVYKAKEVT